VWLHVGLFLLTLITTTLVGADVYVGFLSDFGQRPVRFAGWLGPLGGGLWYSVPALLILLAHEMGHYLACRYYRIRASLPYFLPMPAAIWIPSVGWVGIGLFGTFGAVIRIREPIRRKQMLFDIGIAGPLGGMLVAIPALIVGLAWSRVTKLPPNFIGIELGEPLAYQITSWWLFGTVEAGYSVNMHPMGFAAWFGMFLTALNLIPAGQLDGGHVAYGCLGRHAHWLTYLSCAVVLILGLAVSRNWLVWLAFLSVLLTLFGWRHPPVVDENAPLGTARWILAIVAIIVLVMCFIPVPIELILPQ
jgi:membrane-associated protease RseP (regulator of RpoE activity)